jgi:predicted dehydrogenase
VSFPGDPIGVGIVGLGAASGWAAGAHVPALALLDGIELRGLVAGSPATTRAAGERYGVATFGSAAELAESPEIDLVVVSVKVPHHREALLPVLDAGVPVLCEWPLAVDVGEAEELERAARGKRAFVGLHGRLLPSFRGLAELIAAGYVGEVLSATVLASATGWGDPVSDRLLYTLDRRSGATLLTISFGHMIDAVALVLGELVELAATTATRRPQVPRLESGGLAPMSAADQVAISGRLEGGAVLSAHHRAGLATGAGFALRIDGTEGTLEVTAPADPHLSPLTVRGSRGRAALAALELPEPSGGTVGRPGTPVYTVARAYAAIRDDLIDGTATVPDFRHALRRHRLLDAIERSAATGQRLRREATGSGEPPDIDQTNWYTMSG